MIKADNYNYTKNITKDHINLFESSLKDLSDSIDSKYKDVLTLNFKDSLANKKIKIHQIYDFIYDFNRDFIIVFDGEDNFQIWGNFSSEEKDIKDKFKNILKKDKKIKLFKVNKRTGLVSNYFKDIEHFKKFKKSESTMDKIYKKEINKTFNWNSKKISKKVQDYLKFKHDQLIDMVDFKNHKYKLEDRDEDNFYKQVRNASFEIIKKAQLNNYVLGIHVIRRMEERSISPTKFLTVINEGTQVRSDMLPYKIYIKKGTLVIVVDNRERRFLTIMREEKFSDIDDKNLALELEQGYSRAASDKEKKELTLKDLEKFKTVEEIKTYLNITEADYRRDDIRIKNLKHYSKAQPLTSNPPYVGDMLEYIKKRQKEDSKLATLLDNLVSFLEKELI